MAVLYIQFVLSSIYIIKLGFIKISNLSGLNEGLKTMMFNKNLLREAASEGLGE